MHFSQILYDFVIFPVFKAPRGAVLTCYKWSRCHDFSELFCDFVIFPVFKAPRGAVLVYYKWSHCRYRVQQHSLQCASGRSASLLHIKCARFSFAPCYFLLPHAQHGERDFSITNMHLHSRVRQQHTRSGRPLTLVATGSSTPGSALRLKTAQSA